MGRIHTALVEAGRLISTTDMEAAELLSKVVRLAELTGGREERRERIDADTMLIVAKGELYYLAIA